jgi:hypothetical protein
MRDAVCDLADVLLQMGAPMRKQSPEVAPATRDTSTVFNNSGRNVRSDAHGYVATCAQTNEQQSPTTTMADLRKEQSNQPWRTHQSIARAERGHCSYDGCPSLGISTGKRKRSYRTYMRCEECSLEFAKDVYFCNDRKSGKPVLCHMLYHRQHHKKDKSV